MHACVRLEGRERRLGGGKESVYNGLGESRLSCQIVRTDIERKHETRSP